MALYQLAYSKAVLAPGDASIEQLLATTRDGQPKFVAQPARSPGAASDA